MDFFPEVPPPSGEDEPDIQQVGDAHPVERALAGPSDDQSLAPGLVR